jgi:hypothetical protein
VYASAHGFFLGMMAFIGQHSFPGPAGPLPFLTANLFDPLLLGRLDSKDLPFDLIQQDAPGEEPVQTLRARLLAFHRLARWAVKKNYTSCGFVDVLPACPGGSDEALLKVRFTHAQPTHSFEQGLYFWARDRKSRHGLLDFNISIKYISIFDPIDLVNKHIH